MWNECLLFFNERTAHGALCKSRTATGGWGRGSEGLGGASNICWAIVILNRFCFDFCTRANRRLFFRYLKQTALCCQHIMFWLSIAVFIIFWFYLKRINIEIILIVTVFFFFYIRTLWFHLSHLGGGGGIRPPTKVIKVTLVIKFTKVIKVTKVTLQL